jgi:uncharacterized protein
MTPDPGKLGLLLRMVVYLLVVYIALFVLSLVFIGLLDSLISTVLVVAGAALLANLFALRIFERGRLADIGLGFHGAWLRHLGIGMGLATAAGAVTVLVPMALGLARWTPTQLQTVSWSGLTYTMLMLGLGVIGEELFFRGYGLQVALPVLGQYATLLPMGAWFALAHSGNLNVGWLALFNTFAWGVVLGWAVLRSGDLWLAIGLHAGWNWVLPLLGVNLSGFTMKLTGYDVQWSLSEVWSGGAYGPEGGLLCTVVVALLVMALMRAPLRPQKLLLLRDGKAISEGGSVT